MASTTGDAPEYSHWLIIASTIFLIWTLLFAGVRTWAKLKRSLPWSFYDNIFTVALVVAIAQCITTFLAVSYGYGDVGAKVSDESQLQGKKALFSGQILYILSIGLSKGSTALFLGSLSRAKHAKKASVAVAGVVAVWTVASMLVIAIRGNLSSPWLLINGTQSLYTRWLGIEASGLALELMLWLFSTTLVWGLQMSLQKRLKVVGLFGFRLLLIPIVVGRIYLLSPTNNENPNFSSIMVNILTEGAMFYSLIAECMTCLKPFLRAFHSGYGFSTNYGLHSLSSPMRDPYAQISNVSATDREIKRPMKVAERETHRDESIKSTQRRPRRAENNFELRSDHSHFITNVEAAKHHRNYSDEDDVQLLHRHNTGTGIKQTTTVSVIDESIGQRR